MCQKHLHKPFPNAQKVVFKKISTTTIGLKKNTLSSSCRRKKRNITIFFPFFFPIVPNELFPSSCPYKTKTNFQKKLFNLLFLYNICPSRLWTKKTKEMKGSVIKRIQANFKRHMSWTFKNQWINIPTTKFQCFCFKF